MSKYYLVTVSTPSFDAYLGDCSWEYSIISKEDYERMAEFY